MMLIPSPKVMKLCLILSLGYNLCFIGASMNMFAVDQNGGKMPVLAGYSAESAQHIFFESKEHINVLYLTDIFYVWGIYFSLGDVVIYLSGVSTMVYLIYAGVRFMRIHKDLELKV